jgi:hypothetical protein
MLACQALYTPHVGARWPWLTGGVVTGCRRHSKAVMLVSFSTTDVKWNFLGSVVQSVCVSVLARLASALRYVPREIWSGFEGFVHCAACVMTPYCACRRVQLLRF